jgi:hypothetical protein
MGRGRNAADTGWRGWAFHPVAQPTSFAAGSFDFAPRRMTTATIFFRITLAIGLTEFYTIVSQAIRIECRSSYPLNLVNPV